MGAVAQAAGSGTIAGYSYHDMVAYYLLSMIGRAFSSMPGLASGIARQIRNGEIKKFLIQPVDLIGFQLLMRVAHKLVYYGIALVPFAIAFFLFRGYFSGWPPLETLAAFVVSLMLSFLLGFFLEMTIGMIGFWFLEVSSLLFVYMLFNFFLSGHMFPLDILPEPFGTIVKMIPLQYLAYFPAAVFLEKISGPALWWGLAIQFGWVLFFIVASRVAYARGVRRYSGFGG
jgi:ABC-2 type transport system permease protein